MTILTVSPRPPLFAGVFCGGHAHHSRSLSGMVTPLSKARPVDIGVNGAAAQRLGKTAADLRHVIGQRLDDHEGLGERKVVGDGDVDARRRDRPASSAASRSAAPPVSAMVGLPEGRLTTPMSRQKTPRAHAGPQRLGAGFLGGEALGVGGRARSRRRSDLRPRSR